MPVHPLHRAPRRGRHLAFGGQPGRQLRQRAGRDDQRGVQCRGIHRRGPGRSFEGAEYAILEWVDWFNIRRLLELIEKIPPAEAEVNYYAARETDALAAQLTKISPQHTRCGSVRRAAGHVDASNALTVFGKPRKAFTQVDIVLSNIW